MKIKNFWLRKEYIFERYRKKVKKGKFAYISTLADNYYHDFLLIFLKYTWNYCELL